MTELLCLGGIETDTGCDGLRQVELSVQFEESTLIFKVSTYTVNIYVKCVLYIELPSHPYTAHQGSMSISYTSYKTV